MTYQPPTKIAPLPVKLRVEDYLLLDGAGAFDAYAKTELVDGEILATNAQYRPHMFVKSELAFAMRTALTSIGSALFVGTEASMEMSIHNMAEPDILLTSQPRGDGPVPLASVALIVEVADASLENDLNRKAMLYARHGIAEYWVADVNGLAVRQMWAPRHGSYAEARNTPFGTDIEAVTITGMRVATTALL